MRKNKIWLKSKRLAILAAMSAMMALTMGCSMSQFAFLKPGGGQLQRPQARQPEEAARIADNSPEPSPGAVAAEPALSPDPVIEEALLEPLGPAGQAAPEGAPELAIEAAAEIDAALEAGAHPAEGALSAEGLSPEGLSQEGLSAEALSPEALSQEDLTAEALSQQNLDQDGSSLEAGLALSSSEPVLATGLSSPADSVQFLEAAGTNEDVAALMAAAPALDGYADEGSQEAMEADSEDLADQAAYYEPVLINPALCSNGLTGTLATGRAGQGLLAAHGRSDPPSWVISAPL
ncbi:MAG: hypothetical protein LBE49_07735, partial [Deltaproteobacteria bacterium]|nr:hypothetical protein [Deltaproteobacteria bacterium]